jgi:NAD(P)H-hydrate repair Nnr-like enzyme with NAD(P)H-hydrate dehydratase domain
MVSPLVLNRALDANKADHGSLGVLGGDTGTVGAAFLSARAALMTGTGRVYVVRLRPSCVGWLDLRCP